MYSIIKKKYADRYSSNEIIAADCIFSGGGVDDYHGHQDVARLVCTADGEFYGVRYCRHRFCDGGVSIDVGRGATSVGRIGGLLWCVAGFIMGTIILAIGCALIPSLTTTWA